MNSKYLLEDYCDNLSNAKEDKDDYDKEAKATLPSEGGGWDGPAYPRCRRCCKHFSHDHDGGGFDDNSQ